MIYINLDSDNKTENLGSLIKTIYSVAVYFAGVLRYIFNNKTAYFRAKCVEATSYSKQCC